MKALVLILIAVGMLTSCLPWPTPAARTPYPTLTEPAPAPTGTPTALAPSPTLSPVLFRDEFGIAFASGWDWRGRDPQNVSLTAQHGSLQLVVGPGYALEDGLASLLLRAAPQGDYQIETRLSFLPARNYQFAGLIVYESRDAYLQAGREMCRATPGCVGDGLYLDEYLTGRLQSGGVALAYHEGNVVYLRLEHKGQDYTFFTSSNGAVWSPIGKRQSDLRPLYVGLFAGQSREGAPAAYFDYFEISSLEQ